VKKGGPAVAIWYTGVGFILGSFLLAPLWAKALMIGVLMMLFTQEQVFADEQAAKEEEEWREVMRALAKAVRRDKGDANGS
jgi:fatty acid desaturase